MSAGPTLAGGSAPSPSGAAVPLLLGLIVAASFGSGDFLGGLASRRMPTVTALGIAQITTQPRTR